MDESGQEKNNNITPASGQPEDAGANNKRFPRKYLIFAGSSLVILIVAGAFLLIKDRPEQANQKVNDSQSAAQDKIEAQAVEQVFISPVDDSKTEINSGDFYRLTAGDKEYYGQVSKINDEYLRLAPMVYNNKSASNRLTLSGNELHGPELYTYFNLSTVTKVQKMDASANKDKTIVEYLKSLNIDPSKNEDAFPSQNINDYVKKNQFKAFFFTDGSVFFARVSNLDGEFMAKSGNVFHLRVNSPRSSAGGDPDVSLVLAKPTQYNKLTAEKLFYWQNMKSDSQIAKAAADFEKSQ